MAGVFLLIGFSLLALAHMLILLKLLPGDIFWGGQMKNAADLRRSEWMALLITCMFALPVLIRLGWLGNRTITARAGLWLLVVYMLLNAAGNLLAASWAEKWFALPALLMAVCAWRLTYFEKK
jgi:hypothetical protein